MTTLKRVNKEDLEEGKSYFVRDLTDWSEIEGPEFELWRKCSKDTIKYMRKEMADNHEFYGPIELEGE